MNYPPHAQPPYGATPPQKNGFPTWAIVLIVAIPMFIAVMGIFAVLAIFGVRKYIVNAKSAEARNVLGAVAKRAQLEWAETHRVCPSASQPIPETPPRNAKYMSSPQDWQMDAKRDAGFACLKFSMNEPQYYSSEYTATATSFRVVARGDLNGDGVASEFSIAGDRERRHHADQPDDSRKRHRRVTAK